MTSLIRIPGVRADERGRVVLLALHNIAVISVTIAGKSVRDGYFLSRFDRSALPLMMFAIAVAVSIAGTTVQKRAIESPLGSSAAGDGSRFCGLAFSDSPQVGRLDDPTALCVDGSDHRHYGSAVLVAGV
jgi:hypothetical protein